MVAFFGAGAYATLILGGTPQDAHLGGFQVFYPLALAGGMLAAGALAWVVGVLTLRLRHDYLAIATFGVAVAFENLMRNAEWLAGGAQGLRGFERPLHAWLGDGFTYNALFLIFVLLLLMGTYLFLQRLILSPFGRLLRAIREDETAARSLGKNPRAHSSDGICHWFDNYGACRWTLCHFLRFYFSSGCIADPDLPNLGDANRWGSGQQQGSRGRCLSHLGGVVRKRLGAVSFRTRGPAALYWFDPVHTDRIGNRRNVTVATTRTVSGKTGRFTNGTIPICKTQGVKE